MRISVLGLVCSLGFTLFSIPPDRNFLNPSALPIPISQITLHTWALMFIFLILGYFAGWKIEELLIKKTN